MIGIDFTWINFNGNLTESLEIFTCDLLDCIVEQNQQENFVIITHPMMKQVIQKRFQMFQCELPLICTTKCHTGHVWPLWQGVIDR